MRINNCEQKSAEWWAEKVGRISGTRYGQATSSRANRLISGLVAEICRGYIKEGGFVTEAMQFGIDNEPAACDLYSAQSGIEWEQVGLIYSDFSIMHIASPDRISPNRDKILEVKCTMEEDIHVERFFNGPESGYLPQIINYFACSDQIREVHWVSYCPDFETRPLVVKVFKAEQFKQEIIKGRYAIKAIERNLPALVQQIKDTF
jgi:hypothetical protein